MHAMILAAGRGERMRPLTDSSPKPLLKVAGKPLIVWHLERLAAAGISKVVINHAWLGYKVEQMLGTGEQFGVNIQYSRETTGLETAGGIAKALPLLGPQPFLVINGDIWSDWNLINAMEKVTAIEKNNALAWLLLTDNPEHHPEGDFELSDDSRVYPRSDHNKSLTFTGIGVYKPALFTGIQVGAIARLAPLLKQAMGSSQVLGTHYNGRWTDVGTPQRLAQLDQQLCSN